MLELFMASGFLCPTPRCVTGNLIYKNWEDREQFLGLYDFERKNFHSLKYAPGKFLLPRRKPCVEYFFKEESK